MKILTYCTYAICASLAAYIADNELILSVFVVFLFLDTITGVIKYWRLGRFSSNSMKWGILSKFLLLAIPGVLHLLLTSIGVGDKILSVGMSLLVVAEAISIVQNIMIVTTGEDIMEQDAVTTAIGYILRKLNNLLQTIGGNHV